MRHFIGFAWFDRKKIYSKYFLKNQKGTFNSMIISIDTSCYIVFQD